MRTFLLVSILAGIIIPSAVFAQNADSPCLVSAEDIEATIPADEQDEQPLDGRLGGQLPSWNNLYGNGRQGDDENIRSYALDGCGARVEVYFAYERAATITLYSDRPDAIADGTLRQPDEANWTQDEALAIARNVLPKDSELFDHETTETGTVFVPGESEVLGTYSAQERYDLVDATGEVGSLEVVLSLDDADDVFAIDVRLGGYGDGNEDKDGDGVVEDQDGDGVVIESEERESATDEERSGSPSPCVFAAAESENPLDARLGGTRDGFEARYGAPIREDELFIEYDIEGCGTVFVGYYEGIITDITVFSPREGDTPYLEPDDADWAISQAITIAEGFLPLDRAQETTNLDDPEWVLMDGTSEALLTQVPAEAYAYVDNTPAQGEYQALLWKTTAGDISWITIGLDVEEFL